MQLQRGSTRGGMGLRADGDDHGPRRAWSLRAIIVSGRSDTT
jgi:hypothetical protein